MTSIEHVLSDLNEPQRQAVTSTQGPLLILAGPGSGKTRVITHRIAYLVGHDDVAPWRILAVTFTNKAAREMRQRVEARLGDVARDVVLGTFHAICARFLRTDGQHAGIDRSFTIYDDADQVAVIKRVAEDMNINTRQVPERAILSAISRAKSELISAYDFASTTHEYFTEVVARSYERYEQVLAANNALDFDDLIVRTVNLLRDHAPTREKYQDRFLHVLVDEFQDTNIAQYQLARLLAAKFGNICVVGDPDQSIYSWRSADIRNILDFERDFPGAQIVLLEQNYRSTQTILDAAHAVISGNEQRKEKALWTDRGEGEPIVMFEAYDERDEAQFVAAEVASLTKHGMRLQDIAVMYRTNAQSRALEEALIGAGIPYQLVGGTRFYERREIKDVLAYLRLVHNPFDAVAFTRVANVPGRGVGEKTMEQFQRWAATLGLPLYAALQVLAAQQDGNITPEIARMPRHPLAARQATALRGFLGIIDELIALAPDNPLSVLVGGLLDRTQYRRYLFDEPGRGAGEDQQSEAEARWANVQELAAYAAEFDGLAGGEGLAAFLENAALVSDADEMAEGDDAAGRATLITLHSAKGLEFPVVFMIAMEDGVLPHVRSFDTPAQMEEERRLCYVGMTRAKERLYLLRAFRRYGGGASQHNPASRFLRDIPPSLVSARADASEPQEPMRYRAPAPRDDRPEVPGSDAFHGGERVRHPKFGEGVVVGCKTSGGDQEVTVSFKGVGLKTLSLSIAPLERL